MHHQNDFVRALAATASLARSPKAVRCWRALTCATLLASLACESSELDRDDAAIAADDAGGSTARSDGEEPEDGAGHDGGGDADAGAGSEQAGTWVGAAGGTVTGPNGAKVVIPAGALASDIRIAI